MKKTVIFYVFMLLFIALLTVLMNMPFAVFSPVEFPKILHEIFEVIISILLFLIFLLGNNLYSKTNDGRFLVLSVGFLVGLLFNSVHIFTVNVSPYDTLSFENIKNNPTLFYLLMCNLILPLSICFSILYKPVYGLEKINCKSKIYSIYFGIFSIITISSILIYLFLHKFLNNFYIVMHSLEYVNYALYLMLATILINSGFNSKQSNLNKFTVGLFVLGFGGLFYINHLSIPIHSILAHVFQIIGLLLILLGLPQLQLLAASMKIKDELITYLSLILIVFYIIFVPIATGVYHVVFPQYSGYLFVELLLIFQFIIYLLSAKSLSQVTKIHLSRERNRALVMIYESMRRISNKDIIKNTIIDIINKDFNADRCYIILYDSDNKSFYYDKYIEKLPSKILYDIDDLENEALRFERFRDIFNQNIEICFENAEEYITKNSLKGTEKEDLLREYNIKSYFSIPIKYYDKPLGYLVLEYTKKYRKLSNDDFSYLKEIAKQLGIVINS